MRTYRTVTSIPPNNVPAIPAQNSVDKLKGRMTALTFEPIKRVDVTLVLQHDLLNGPLPPLVDLSSLLSLFMVADHDG